METEVLLKQASPDPNGSSFREAASPLEKAGNGPHIFTGGRNAYFPDVSTLR